jgi:hypothetical protein
MVKIKIGAGNSKRSMEIKYETHENLELRLS